MLAVHGGAVLLLRGSDPARPEDGTWWFTVGGGCEGGESTAEAARREAFEEAGLVLPDDLGPVVLHRVAEFSFEGQDYRQTEDFYFCRVDSDAVVTTGWTELERRSMTEHRWWSAAELAGTADVVHPEQLAGLLATLLAAERPRPGPAAGA
ncbi:ADP-ribose pyrophosphatase YjhB, NUDIX family [Friedmanniella luteola]|uniref:ADP-ribose pyrophosphatase YjhB, NUDIX family n=1 Tax=Friedmanniella luteola TaxID=546871 RepID=A0A1H2A543_9ACTN|nr:ADP-ribose pyrophosphatase YjhB, NUDIX family [Friedmanniella luteola]